MHPKGHGGVKEVQVDQGEPKQGKLGHVHGKLFKCTFEVHFCCKCTRSMVYHEDCMIKGQVLDLSTGVRDVDVDTGPITGDVRLWMRCDWLGFLALETRFVGDVQKGLKEGCWKGPKMCFCLSSFLMIF